MKLFLTSSGFANPELEAALLKLINKPRGTFDSIFVPTAADPESDRSFVSSALCAIQAISREVIELDLTRSSHSAMNAAFSKAALVHVNGGNTFYLLHHIRVSGFAPILRGFLARGGVYSGSSAGSIVASPTIEIAGLKGFDDPTVVELESLEALHLVDQHLFVHYEPRWEDLIAHEAKHLAPHLIRLADGQAFIVDGNTTRLAP